MFTTAWQVARRPGVAVILVNAVLMYSGFFMLIPFISVYGTRELGLTGAAVGAVLATRIILQQGLTMFGGVIADYIGYKPILAAGIFVRMIGFTMFAFVADFWGMMAAAIVSALGGAMFEATHKAALASFVPARERTIVFSLVSTVGRIGTMLGPLIAVALLPIGFATLSLTAAACYVIALIGTITFMPVTRGMTADGQPWTADSESSSEKQGTATMVLQAFRIIPNMFRLVWADKPFVRFTALQTGYWFVFSQIFLTLPLYVSLVSGSDWPIGALLAINSAFALIAQYPVIAWIGRRAASLPIIIGGFGVMSIGLASFALGASVPSSAGPTALVIVLTLPVLLYGLGDLLVQPTLTAMTSDLAKPEALGSYFGFASFAIALGGGIGNALGGWLFDQTRALGLPHALWLLYGGITAMLAIAFYRYSRGAQPAPAPLASEAVLD